MADLEKKLKNMSRMQLTATAELDLATIRLRWSVQPDPC